MRMIAAVCFAVLGAAVASGEGVGIRLRVTNPLDAARPMETVEVAAAALAGSVAAEDLSRARRHRRTDRPRGPQPGGGRGRRRDLRPAGVPVRLRAGRDAGVPPRAASSRKPRLADYRVYGRFVRERHDDFAWENDRGRLPDLRPGARDVREGAPHEQRGRRLEQADAAPRAERLVPRGRLPPRPRRRRRLLLGRQEPRLRGQRPRGRRRARGLEELPLLAGARRRARSGSSSRSSTPSGRGRG